MMNDADHTLLVIIGGTALILIIVSAIGWALALRCSPDGSNAAIEDFNDRIRAWWVMAVVLSLAILGGRIGVILLFALCSFAALREFLTPINLRRADHWSLVMAFFVVLPFQYYMIWADWYGLFTIFIPVYVFLLLPVVSVLRGETSNYLIRIAELQWGLMICVFCASHVPGLLTLNLPGFEGRNILLIAFLVVIVQLSDVLQYVWSKLLGRHKIAPGLSPSKTVEGFIGGSLSATAIGAALWWMTPFGIRQAALMAFIIALMGFFGSLVMSAIKRDRGIKDWGHSIAGRGSFIDRLDPVVFSAPVFFHLTRCFWAV